jgi:hypothetical protein
METTTVFHELSPLLIFTLFIHLLLLVNYYYLLDLDRSSANYCRAWSTVLSCRREKRSSRGNDQAPCLIEVVPNKPWLYSWMPIKLRPDVLFEFEIFDLAK